jgi:hypothetical protein
MVLIWLLLELRGQQITIRIHKFCIQSVPWTDSFGT